VPNDRDRPSLVRLMHLRDEIENVKGLDLSQPNEVTLSGSPFRPDFSGFSLKNCEFRLKNERMSFTNSERFNSLHHNAHRGVGVSANPCFGRMSRDRSQVDLPIAEMRSHAVQYPAWKEVGTVL
jgi:hypothetical protein